MIHLKIIIIGKAERINLPRSLIFRIPLYETPLFHCGKTLFQVRDDVVDMLCSDGQTNGIFVNASVFQLLRCHLRMSGGCRMDDQRFHICHIGQQGENFQFAEISF